MTNGPTRRAAVVTALALFHASASVAKRNLKIAVFSKHLQFLEGPELAQTAAGLGFDGVDITVRAGGHVEPAEVSEKLPSLVALIRQNGLEVPMVTTDIVDAGSPFAENVLKTLHALGIRYYRWGGFKYEPDEPLSRQFEGFRQRSARLALLNARYEVCAIYHTHSGVGLVGAPVWDIFQILNGLDPEAVAINYDVGHATVEGGLGGWIDSFRLAGRYIRGVAFKDFFWRRDPGKGWAPNWVPLGEGMVRFPVFCSMLAETSFDGPVQLHFEYPLGGANDGKRQIAIGRQQVFSAMRRDLRRLRGYLNTAGLLHA